MKSAKALEVPDVFQRRDTPKGHNAEALKGKESRQTQQQKNKKKCNPEDWRGIEEPKTQRKHQQKKKRQDGRHCGYLPGELGLSASILLREQKHSTHPNGSSQEKERKSPEHEK